MADYWATWVIDGTAATTTDAVWVNWTSGTTTSVTFDPTWVNWHTSTTTSGYSQAIQSPVVTAEESARLQDEWREQQKQLQREKQAAKQRAEAILKKNLTPAQKRQRTRYGWFHVHGSAGRLYRVHTDSQAGNVREMARTKRGRLRAIAQLCCHPRGLPDADAHLAQLLWLKHDEEQFRRTANITRYLQ